MEVSSTVSTPSGPPTQLPYSANLHPGHPTRSPSTSPRKTIVHPMVSSSPYGGGQSAQQQTPQEEHERSMMEAAKNALVTSSPHPVMSPPMGMGRGDGGIGRGGRLLSPQGQFDRRTISESQGMEGIGRGVMLSPHGAIMPRSRGRPRGAR